MKFGLLLHPEHGVDAVMAEARAADRQGYDSIWLSDHMMSSFGPDGPDGPYDALTLMIALGAVTRRVRLAWAMLNVGFRRPAVLAKTLATLDHITKGRVIAALGSGWLKKEFHAYDLPMLDDHDAQVGSARETIRLLQQLWTHPAPERVTFEGAHVHVKDLPFSPAPFQKPHPPIWWGGDSDASVATVKQLADGWVTLHSSTKERLAREMSAPDWPKRPITIVKNTRIFVADTREEAAAQVRAAYTPGAHKMPPTLDEYFTRVVHGTPADCFRQLDEFRSWGVNYMRLEFYNAEHQERVARLILPHYEESRAAVSATA